jgi:hypothetical protein
MSNRLLKFRVWNKHVSSWLFPNSKVGDWSGGSGNAINLWCYKETGLSVHSISSGSIEIVEWTGLTLPHGTEIYEGDILNTKDARWEVVFERGAFVAKWVMGVGDENTRHILWPMMEHAILIGNRFESPELLDNPFAAIKETEVVVNQA